MLALLRKSVWIHWARPGSKHDSQGFIMDPWLTISWFTIMDPGQQWNDGWWAHRSWASSWLIYGWSMMVKLVLNGTESWSTSMIEEKVHLSSMMVASWVRKMVVTYLSIFNHGWSMVDPWLMGPQRFGHGPCAPTPLRSSWHCSVLPRLPALPGTNWRSMTLWIYVYPYLSKLKIHTYIYIYTYPYIYI